MPVLPPQPASVQCPNCRTTFTTPIYSLIDAGKQPELKNALLSGQINVAVCPGCGAGGMLATPLIYHDPAKQLFLALLPQELNIKPEEAERFIGDLTRFVMADLPNDVPKGYLLTPRRFISLQSLVDAVLEAEGVSKEMLAAQRKRVELIGRLAEALEQDRQQQAQGEPGKAFQELAEQHKQDFDYEFFLMLTALLEASTREQQQESADLLSEVRQRLMELTGFDAAAAGLEEPDEERILQNLLDAPSDQLREVIAEYRPYIDYGFFQFWSEQIEAAERAGDTQRARKLSDRRKEVVELTERMDKEAQTLFEEAGAVLREVLFAPDPQAALRERREKINEAFMLVVDANIAAAQRANRAEDVQRLQEIQRLAVEVVQEAMSPEERLINQLLTAESPQESTKLLRANAAKVTPDFVKKVNELAEQMEKGGRKELAERLRQIGREAASLLF
ncbi:MAG: hypothetical protein KatS3mg057_0481 [Herpetosiphonaceae bacterium]|nr:MAG: hypothetical protein KatS3mg057_0481 [Herpetosiphonaceae bacterium]